MSEKFLNQQGLVTLIDEQDKKYVFKEKYLDHYAQIESQLADIDDHISELVGDITVTTETITNYRLAVISTEIIRTNYRITELGIAVEKIVQSEPSYESEDDTESSGQFITIPVSGGQDITVNEMSTINDQLYIMNQNIDRLASLLNQLAESSSSYINSEDNPELSANVDSVSVAVGSTTTVSITNNKFYEDTDNEIITYQTGVWTNRGYNQSIVQVNSAIDSGGQSTPSVYTVVVEGLSVGNTTIHVVFVSDEEYGSSVGTLDIPITVTEQ